MSEATFGDVPPPMRARMRTGLGGPYGEGGMGLSTMGRIARRGSGPPGVYMDGADGRIRSAPDLHGGFGPAGRGPPQAGVRGLSPNVTRGMSPGVPRYAAPRYAAGMATPGGDNPYAYPWGRAGAPLQGRAQTPVASMQPQPRRPLRPTGSNEVPMGAYATGAPPPPVRANTEPTTSSRLNRGSPANRKAGPSGQEWIEGDPFLDACTCTTNCNCRRGQRVLYRSRAQGREGQDGWGEIRYVLKDDLGRDCGDHSKCTNQGGEGREGTRKQGKGNREACGNDEESREFQDEMREHMAAMKQALADMTFKNRSGGARAPGGLPYGGMPPHEGLPAMMEGTEPRMASQMGRGRYGIRGPGRLPGMGGRMGGRMEGVSGLAMPGPFPGELRFEDDDPIPEPGFGMGGVMGPMGMEGQPRRRMGGGRSMQPDLMPPPRVRGRGVPRGQPSMGVGVGDFGFGPPMAGRSMGGHRPRGGSRRRRPAFRGEEVEMGMGAGAGTRPRTGGFGGGFDDYRGMEDEDDEAAWEDEDGKLSCSTWSATMH